MTDIQRNSKDFQKAFTEGFAEGVKYGLEQQRKPILLHIKLSDKTIKQIALTLDELKQNSRKTD